MRQKENEETRRPGGQEEEEEEEEEEEKNKDKNKDKEIKSKKILHKRQPPIQEREQNSRQLATLAKAY